MNYTNNFNLFGVEVRQRPCIKGKGEPSDDIASAEQVGELYLDEDSRIVYVCVPAGGGDYVWRQVEPRDELYELEEKIKDKLDKETFDDFVANGGGSGGSGSNLDGYTIVNSWEEIKDNTTSIPTFGFMEEVVNESINVYVEDVKVDTISKEAAEEPYEYFPTVKAVYSFVKDTIADIKTIKHSEKGHSYVYITDHAQESQDIKITVEMIGSVYGSLYVVANGGTIAQFDDLEEGINTRIVHIEPGFDEIEFETDPNDCKVTVEYKPNSKVVMDKTALEGKLDKSIFEEFIANGGDSGTSGIVDLGIYQIEVDPNTGNFIIDDRDKYKEAIDGARQTGIYKITLTEAGAKQPALLIVLNSIDLKGKKLVTQYLFKDDVFSLHDLMEVPLPKIRKYYYSTQINDYIWTDDEYFNSEPIFQTTTHMKHDEAMFNEYDELSYPSIAAMVRYVDNKLQPEAPIKEPPEMLEVNKEYNFGVVDELHLVFPSLAEDGDVIYITFYAEAAVGESLNLVIDTTNTSDIDLIPENATGYEIFAKFVKGGAITGDYWIVNYSEHTL